MIFNFHLPLTTDSVYSNGSLLFTKHIFSVIEYSPFRKYATKKCILFLLHKLIIIGAAIARYPDRYIGFGAVPIGLDLQETLQYVSDVICKNGLTGMGEFTPGSGQIHLMRNIFCASLEFNNLPVWVHAFFPLTIQDINEIAALALDYPNTPVILGHLGGCNWLETIKLVKEIPDLYLDTSAYYSTFVLSTVINEVPHKCLFGVDRPFGDLQISKDTILRMANTTEIADAVLGGNIARLLHLTD